MLKKTFLRTALFPAVILALHGCAATPVADAVEKPEPKPAAAPPAEQLPTVELTPGMLYDLLVAEVAAQRGEVELSAVNYMRMASATRDPRVARRATQLAVYASQFDLAEQAARLWTAISPDNLDARQSYAALLIRAGRTEEAAPHLKKLLNGAGGVQQGLGMVARLLGSDRKPERALATFDRLVAEDPSPESGLAGARLALMVERPGVSLERIRQVLAERPDWAEALVMEATALRHLGRSAEAQQAYGRAVAEEPNNAKLRLDYARILVENGDVAEARRQFAELLDQLPDNTDILYALGLLSLQAGDLQGAERHMMRLVELGDRLDESHYTLGQIAEERGSVQLAIERYESVRPDADTWFDAQIRIASLLAARDGIDAARARIHSIRPGDDQDRVRLLLVEGEFLRDRSLYNEALAVFSRGLAAYPGHPDLLYARAMVAEKLDRLDLLESDLLSVLDSDPDNVQALNALGYTLADRTERHDEALAFIRRALEQRPDDPAIIDSMGWVLYRLGRLEEAVTYLRKASAMRPDAEIAAHLGEVLWAKGEREAARAVWDKALEHSPEHEVLKRTVNEFVR